MPNRPAEASLDHILTARDFRFGLACVASTEDRVKSTYVSRS